MVPRTHCTRKPSSEPSFEPIYAPQAITALRELLFEGFFILVGDAIKVWVNGDLVNHGYQCTATKGQIALQAEGSEVEFRKLELTPITQLTE